MPKEKKGNILDIINKREILSVIWSSSTAYTAGQYVAYGNYFYKCIKNTAAGTAPTNATYWEKTNLASEITTLNSNLANIKSPKLLYSESFSSGSIKVPGISEYNVVAYVVDSEYLCIGTPNAGIGGYIHYATKKVGYYAYLFNYSPSIDTIFTDDAHAGVIDLDNSSNAKVNKIYGIA